MSKIYKTIMLILLSMSTLLAQTYTVSGVVTSAASGEKLVGANVFVQGTTTGAATDEAGKFSFTLDAGEYTVQCSYIGFETKKVDIDLTSNMELNFELKDFAFSLNVEVIADRAREFETPVAFTNIDKKDMEQKLGSRDIPMVLNTAPSVYATLGGGAAGDGRVNVRGFQQTNVAVMINGVPVNDMEWGGVYWSNWDGVGDAAGSIQLQRGLSATTLSTPSIGGSMNLISEPTSQAFGINLKQEFGDAAFMKTSLSASSGLIGGKWAFNTTLVRKVGDGVVDGAWTEAYSYYLGAAYNITDNHRIELYALGAPQRHGQRSYRLNIATFSHKFARSLATYDEAALDDPRLAEQGLTYNSNWAKITTDYNGQQYWNASSGDRYDEGFINERENYYHKPQVNLNWYGKFSDMLSLYTTLYYSGGTGGGSGTFGSLAFDYTLLQRVPDWDATIARNIANADGSRGILRNSVNNQYAFGAVSKAILRLSSDLTAQFGVDWRTAEIEHYREVRDLLGGSYFRFTGNEFDSEAQYKKVLGDKIDYNFTNTVDWLGAFAQTEYSTEKITAFAMLGWNMKKYSYVNHFTKGPDGGELTAETDNFSGYQIKLGASYRFNNNLMLYGNGGYISSPPIFDNTINDRTGFIVEDPANELFTSLEGGLEYRNDRGDFSASVGYYYTKWDDRSTTEPYYINQDTEGIILISGMNQLHKGWEFTMAYQPVSLLRFDFSAYLGDWYYTDDVSAVYKDYSSGGAQDVEFNAYVKDLKVGDMPQSGLTLTTTLFPVKGAYVSLVVHTYRDHYADWNPFDRTNEDDRAQSWKIPSHTVSDLHAGYTLPFKFYGVGLEIFGHIFNVFDAVYVSDATDNSSYNAYTANGKNHSADDAEVYFGLPQTFNVGFRLNY